MAFRKGVAQRMEERLSCKMVPERWESKPDDIWRRQPRGLEGDATYRACL
ncbi:MAG: hypothetical protein H0X65_19540 [Gemmatimonadetes bacterium]|nr:hypothetical protein [Gemmatimonadota bacterium]